MVWCQKGNEPLTADSITQIIDEYMHGRSELKDLFRSTENLNVNGDFLNSYQIELFYIHCFGEY